MRVALLLVFVAGVMASHVTPPEQKPATAIGNNRCQGCHGNPDHTVLTQPLTKDVWKSSAMIYHTLDPHRNAWAALSNPLGKKIIERMKYTPQQVAERCATCHSNPTLATSDSPLRAEGVSCEACHGNALNWEAPHTAWDRAIRRTDVGFNVVSAATCAGCHVGSPGRDMNHDMIAAGHPNLGDDYKNLANVEALMKRLPPHWATKPGYSQEMFEKFAGKLKSQRKTYGPQPELAEMDCLKCHQALK